MKKRLLTIAAIILSLLRMEALHAETVALTEVSRRVYAVAFTGDCLGGGSGTYDEQTSSEPGAFAQVAHIGTSAVGAQESVITVTEESLQVRAQGTATLDVQQNICGSFAAAHSAGKATIEVATACSFVLRAATTTATAALLDGYATIYLLERGPKGEQILASFFANESGTISGNLVPGHSYELGFAAVRSSADSFTNPGSDSYNLMLEVTAPPKITSATRPPDGHFVINGRAIPNSFVQIEASPDLVAPFTFLGVAASDANGNFRYDDAEAAMLPKRFYRASYSAATGSALQP